MDAQKIQDEVREWSDNTFGRNRIALPMVYHLKDEVDELITSLDILYKTNYPNYESGDILIKNNIEDVKYEFADCLMLLIDSAAHLPISMDELFNYVLKKLEINKKRKWGEPDKNGVIKRIE